MVSLQNSPSIHQTWLSNASTQVDFMPQLGMYRHGPFQRSISFLVKAEQISAAPTSSHQDPGGVNLLPWGQHLLLGFCCPTRNTHHCFNFCKTMADILRVHP
ncbi:hypothetical protein CsSME_00006660 [Camellia sinensis var. sinensis]